MSPLPVTEANLPPGYWELTFQLKSPFPTQKMYLVEDKDLVQGHTPSRRRHVHWPTDAVVQGAHLPMPFGQRVLWDLLAAQPRLLPLAALHSRSGLTLRTNTQYLLSSDQNPAPCSMGKILWKPLTFHICPQRGREFPQSERLRAKASFFLRTMKVLRNSG